jgi:hypothetical protein
MAFISVSFDPAKKRRCSTLIMHFDSICRQRDVVKNFFQRSNIVWRQIPLWLSFTSSGCGRLTRKQPGLEDSLIIGSGGGPVPILLDRIKP